jgi:hypothetical protein
LVVVAVFLAWLGFRAIQRPEGPESAKITGAPRVLAEGVLYEAQGGDPAVVTAQDISSGKQVWRSELGTITKQPVLIVEDEVIEVEVAGTPWMTLERASGKPVE